jgi:hypothetical protein
MMTDKTAKREALAGLALGLRSQLAIGDDIEIVVVVCTTDGEFVGVSANVSEERADEILCAAVVREDHVDHPNLAVEQGEPV